MSFPALVRIVGLNGSPRRGGNTATLMGWVLEGCSAVGASVEWIHVADHDIGYCQGCFTCLRTGACPIQDDVPHIRERLLEANGIVAGSPVYEGQPTALFKTLLDRLTLLNLYTRTFDRQRSVGVATSGVAPTGGVAKQLATFFGQPTGTIGAKTASIQRGYQPLTEASHPSHAARARAMGQRLVAEMRSPSRLRIPTPQRLWIHLLRRFVVSPLVYGNAEMFAGVLQIWEQKGWYQVSTK